MKIDDLEKERKECRSQIMQLQKAVNENNKSNGIPKKQANQFESEIFSLKTSISDKDKTISNLQAKIATLDSEVKQQSSLKVDLSSAQDLLKSVNKEKESLTAKLNTILNTKMEEFPSHTPKIPTELTPKSHLKKWVIELENEVQVLTGLLKKNIDAKNFESEYKKVQEKCNKLESELSKLKHFLLSFFKMEGSGQKQFKKHSRRAFFQVGLMVYLKALAFPLSLDKISPHFQFFRES